MINPQPQRHYRSRQTPIKPSKPAEDELAESAGYSIERPKKSTKKKADTAIFSGDPPPLGLGRRRGGRSFLSFSLGPVSGSDPIGLREGSIGWRKWWEGLNLFMGNCLLKPSPSKSF